MKVALVNLGCKVNRVETDTIGLSYLRRGAELVDSGDADLVVVNTCTVTSEAEKKTRKTIRRALRENPRAQVLVTGCAAAIEPAFFEGLDSRITVVEKQDLLTETDGDTVPSISSSAETRFGDKFPTRAGVKVQDGCNHSCTYCIVHVARGKAWSRPYKDVESEVLELARAGVKEIVLTGIDLGSYSLRSERLNLASLSRQLLDALDVQGFDDVRLRISSIEPCSLSNEFIEVLAQSEGRICRHLHLPLQSGSSKVLNEMNRPYSADYFLRRVSDLYEQVPGLSLSSDIIVGFPGETERDFQDTCSVARSAGFSKIHVFRYSKRRGTPAAERTDQVSAQVSEARAKELSALAQELRLKYAQAQVGKIERIVAEGKGWGTTESYFKVHLPATIDAGSLVLLPLTSVDSNAIFSV